jgi:hypothetical protein
MRLKLDLALTTLPRAAALACDMMTSQVSDLLLIVRWRYHKITFTTATSIVNSQEANLTKIFLAALMKTEV